MVNTKELRLIVQDYRLAGSPVFVQAADMDEILNRLEAAEKERDKLKELNSALCTKSNSQVIHNARLAEENDALRAKVAEMEQQEPVAKVRVHKTGGNAGIAWSVAPINDFDSLPLMRDGDRLYALPGAQNIPEKLCYDSRWEISIDYVDGWNAAVDMMRGKSPSWHCPDCCIAFPFGAPKSCPHDDARCNSLLAAASPEAKP